MFTFFPFSFHHYINYSACVSKNCGIIVYIIQNHVTMHACDCYCTSPHRCDLMDVDTHSQRCVFTSVYGLMISCTMHAWLSYSDGAREVNSVGTN